MLAVSIRELLEAGDTSATKPLAGTQDANSSTDPVRYSHLGPSKDGPLFNDAFNFVSAAVSRGESVLFVGTKKQAQEVVRTQALRCGMYHVTHRWLGGTLTNFRTIKQSIERLKNIDRMLTDGTTDALTKKETLRLLREQEKLEANLGGIKSMDHLPGVIFVVDTNKEHIAVSEARKLGIKVIAILDTNSDPEGIDYPIPGNDDAIRAIELFASRVADAVIAGKRQHNERYAGAQGHGGDVEAAVQGDENVEVSLKPAGLDMPAPEASATPDEAPAPAED